MHIDKRVTFFVDKCKSDRIVELTNSIVFPDGPPTYMSGFVVYHSIQKLPKKSQYFPSISKFDICAILTFFKYSLVTF